MLPPLHCRDTLSSSHKAWLFYRTASATPPSTHAGQEPGFPGSVAVPALHRCTAGMTWVPQGVPHSVGLAACVCLISPSPDVTLPQALLCSWLSAGDKGICADADPEVRGKMAVSRTPAVPEGQRCHLRCQMELGMPVRG